MFILEIYFSTNENKHPHNSVIFYRFVLPLYLPLTVDDTSARRREHFLPVTVKSTVALRGLSRGEIYSTNNADLVVVSMIQIDENIKNDVLVKYIEIAFISFNQSRIVFYKHISFTEDPANATSSSARKVARIFKNELKEVRYGSREVFTIELK